MTPTLLLHPRYDMDSQLLWQAAVTRGWQVVRSRRYSAVGLIVGGSVAIYGGYMWAEAIAGELGVRLVSPPDDWLTTLPWRLARREIRLSTIGDVRRGAFPVFVKSLRGKQLDSRVYHCADDLPDVGDEHEVLAQGVIQFAREYRVFVLDGQAVTWSVYADHGAPYFDNELSCAGEAAAFLTTVLRDLALPRACVVDVAEIEGSDWFHRWAIVEANPAWCSGIYGCDPDAVLDVVAACSTS